MQEKIFIQIKQLIVSTSALTVVVYLPLHDKFQEQGRRTVVILPNVRIISAAEMDMHYSLRKDSLLHVLKLSLRFNGYNTHYFGLLDVNKTVFIMP